MAESTETTEDEPQSAKERALLVGFCLVCGVVAGIVMNWLVLQSAKPADHAVAGVLIGGIVTITLMILLIDTPGE